MIKLARIGIVSKAGRYGGTYAHTDVTFEFASWISVEFKLYLIKEFQRLKEDENRRLSLAWNLNRTLAKLNYPHPHRRDSDASHSEGSHRKTGRFRLRRRGRPPNVSLFVQTAREWRDANPGQECNMRDQVSLEQLLVLANLENMNAEFIHMGKTLTARIAKQLGRG